MWCVVHHLVCGVQGEDPESAVTFASSVSDSEEDEEGVGGPSTPPRPTLR